MWRYQKSKLIYSPSWMHIQLRLNSLLSKTDRHVTIKFNQWSYSSPFPHIIIYIIGKEFIGYKFQELLSSYNIEPCLTTLKLSSSSSDLVELYATRCDEPPAKEITEQRVTPSFKIAPWPPELLSCLITHNP